jgi:hypothetical protein
MNREIKFRAWTGNRFLDFEEIIACGYTPWLSKSLIWQQFTGLKDKNGKEVYEGDILKYEETGSFGVMTWLGKTAQFGFSNGWANPVHGYANVNEAVIIGNIFENPELINHPLT